MGSLAAVVAFSASLLHAQAPQPDSAALTRGGFPAGWVTGGPGCTAVPKWQVHAYNPDLYILRESGCTHYEKPFLYLFFGKDRALLQDTGAGETNVGEIVDQVIAEWCRRNGRQSIPLVVAHSHGHGDHISGDGQFNGKPNVTVVPLTVEGTQKAYAIHQWPVDRGSIDLGGLYVSDFPAFAASVQRLVEFTRDKPAAHILGCHVEQSGSPSSIILLEQSISRRSMFWNSPMPT